MRTLVIQQQGVKISARKGSLVVITGKEKMRVSPSDIDLVLVITAGASTTSKAIRLLMKHSVDIVFLDTKGGALG